MKRLLCVLVLLIGCAGHRYDPNTFQVEFRCPFYVEVEQHFNARLTFHGPIPEHPVEIALYLNGNVIAASRGFLVGREIGVPVRIPILFYQIAKGRDRGLWGDDEYITDMPPIDGAMGEDDVSVTLEVIIRPAYPHRDTGMLVAEDRILTKAKRNTRLTCMSCSYE